MKQSNIIVGAFFIAFLIFITAKGELPVYIGFLRGIKPINAGDTVAGLKVLDANNLSVNDKTFYDEQNALDNMTSGISINSPAPALKPLPQLQILGGK